MAAKSALFLLALALVAGSTGRALAAGPSWEIGEDLPQRQEAMAEAVRVMANYETSQDGDESVQRAMGVVNRELALLRPIFKAISKMPETEKTAADVGAKEEARAAANALLTRHLGQLLPGGSAKIVEEF
jgi:hypothetical protein